MQNTTVSNLFLRQIEAIVRGLRGLVFQTSTSLAGFKKQTPFHKLFRFNLFCQLLSPALPQWWKVLFNGLECHPSAARPNKEEAPASFWGSSQAFADRLAGALTSQVFKRDKDDREGRGGGLEVEKNEVPNEKEDILKRTEREEEKTYWTDGEVQPFDHLAPWVTTAFICIFRVVQHTKLHCQED